MTLLYTPDLVTLDYVRAHRRFDTAETDDNLLLQQLIHEASADFAEAIARIPMPYVATRTQDYSDPYYIELDEDLLTLTAFTNGDGETITGASFALRPANVYPKRELVLKAGSGSTLVYESDVEDAFSLDGIWGYVPQYPTCWKDTGQDVPVGGMTASSTQMILASAALFEVLQYYRVGDEVIQVTAISTNTITHTRGELGTTAVSHLATDGIDRFQQRSDIMGAVREIAVYRYKAKDRVGGRVTVYDGGAVEVDDLDPLVMKAITRHWRNPGVGAP